MAQVCDVAELGAGEGRLALLFARKGMSAVILDTTDWRDGDVRESTVKYELVQEDSPYKLPGKSIDFFYSYGTLEHVRNPFRVFEEAIRITKVSGYIYIQFGPLYNSPKGLHAFKAFHGPYPQFLLTKQDLDRFVAMNGIFDLGEEREAFQYVNGWSMSAYERACRVA